MNRTRLATTSGLAAAIFMFRCRLMSAGVSDMSIETADPENLGLVVGISILSALERDLQILPVWRPPSWNYNRKLKSVRVADGFFELSDLGNIGLALGIA